MSDRNILVVEDNIINQKLVQVLLTNKGFNVFTAIDSKEAMSVLNKSKLDLILMDIQLPGTNGLDLTKMIKADPKTKDIKIVALTAYAMQTDEEKAKSAGCEAFISKPFDTEELPKTIEELLVD